MITDQDKLVRLEQEIVWTINSAIVVYGEKTQDTEKITEIAKRVRDTISLGLESLLVQQEFDGPLNGQEAAVRASDLLYAWHVTDLFRHGFAASQGLQHEIMQALRNPAFHSWYHLVEMQQSDDPNDRLERAFVSALLGRHPLQGGFNLAKVEEVKAFSCLLDIDVASERLKKLVACICNES